MSAVVRNLIEEARAAEIREKERLKYSSRLYNSLINNNNDNNNNDVTNALILALGKNKFMGICKLSPELPARRIDILIADPSYYYFALLYFTGSYTFNIYMRKIALQKGLSLSEYGFKDIKDTKNIIDTTNIINSEEDIFKYLDMTYVEPHKR